jgi:hypothetical protein
MLKEAESWMRTLNYARFCRAAEDQHPHPLTLYMPNYLLRFQGSEPRSAYKLYEENFTCSGCQKKSNYLGKAHQKQTSGTGLKSSKLIISVLRRHM